MGGGKGFGGKSFGDMSRGLILAFACLAVLAGGCSESKPEKPDDGTFNTSRLPRVSGAKEVFASPATTIFTSPDSVAQTADTVDKALAAGGWQKYVAPNTAYANDPTTRIMSLKKGTQALSVYITGAEQRHQRAIRRVGAQNRSAVYRRRQQYRVLAGAGAVDAGHRRADRQDTGHLPQGARRARLVAVV